MPIIYIVAISLLYLSVLFGIAYYSERNTSLRNRFSKSSIVYTLSLAVYCTAWTFYGSIGKAASSGLGFAGVYLGPTLTAPLWIIILKKIIRISRYLRITSVADFISSRYGKNAKLGVLVSLVSVAVAIPYISIQLKAFAFSIDILTRQTYSGASYIQQTPFYQDFANFFAISFALFAIIFGTLRLDPNEKHSGVVNAVAFESLIKLFTFLIGAICIVYFIFNGVTDIFTQAKSVEILRNLSSIGTENLSYSSWMWIFILSGIAFVLLPRQFHIAVVENNSLKHIDDAAWMLPLYLFLISIFVIPIAYSGVLTFGNSVEADTFLLSLPVQEGYNIVAILIFIGGLSAASSMIVVSMIALSIMVSNNVFLPLLLRFEDQLKFIDSDLNTRLLYVRRVLIVAVMLLAYGFYKAVSINYSIISVGLISFAGIAQLAPLVFLGIYWKYGNRKGAIAGLLVGTILWGYTLPLANLMDVGALDSQILKYGLFNIEWLKPRALFGIEGFEPLPHGAFWSLFLNTTTFVMVSFFTKRTPVEIAQSDIFINPEKYYNQENPNSPFTREADFQELKSILESIVGKNKVYEILMGYFKQNNISSPPQNADSKFIDYIEKYLSGSIGTASANIVLDNIVTQKPIKITELIDVLDQTYQVFLYSKELETTSNQLRQKTKELADANTQLIELDELKNDFINTITHELRTPITSIRSLASTLNKYNVSEAEKTKFLRIIEQESKRISELVNQVLDLRKIENSDLIHLTTFDLKELIETILASFTERKEHRQLTIQGETITLITDKSKLTQTIINVVANAIKFTEPNGHINIHWVKEDDHIKIQIEDDGIGIATTDLEYVFDKFYQVQSQQEGKPKGSGLGLAISQRFIQSIGGELTVESKLKKGSVFMILIPINFEKEQKI